MDNGRDSDALSKSPDSLISTQNGLSQSQEQNGAICAERERSYKQLKKP